MRLKFILFNKIKYILEKAKEISEGLEIILNLFIFAGFVKGEAFGLTWDNVKFENNTISI